MTLSLRGGLRPPKYQAKKRVGFPDSTVLLWYARQDSNGRPTDSKGTAAIK